MKIYSDYGEEPKDVYLPLPERLYCDLYELEMNGFTDDITFYQKNLAKNCSILEVGCGTGRITEALATKYRTVAGIDLSLFMLRKATAKKKSICHYINMDMRQVSFSVKFDTLLIPYNTLNLLSSTDDIITCLSHCRSLLKRDGRIQLQLFLPDEKLKSHGGRLFQFQMFDRPQGGKIIKEVLRLYSCESQTVMVEERYRIRPMKKSSDNHNFNRFFTIAGYSYDTWVSLFHQAGLQIAESWGDYDLSPFHPLNSSSLLATLKV